MPTFRDLQKGIAARTPAKFPLPGARFDFEKGEWTGDTAEVALRVLSIADEADIVGAARVYAKEKGGDAADDDPLFQLGLQVHTVLHACVDPTSPEDASVPFFENFEQIASDKTITRDHIAYLFESQQAWQEECSPRRSKMSSSDYMLAVTRTAGGKHHDFLGMSLALRWSFTRTMASQLLSSLAGSSLSGSSSQAAPPPTN